MDPRKLKFLTSVLGPDGAGALNKASERSPECEAVLVPRAIVAWLNLVSSGYEGLLPGTDTSLTFSKSEDAYTGSITSGDDKYEFTSASLLHLASAVAVSLGVDAERFDPGLKDLDLVRLGKSIDLLCKAHSATVKVAQNEILMKAISQIPAGAAVRQAGGVQAFDYSHVLTPQHRKAGYSIHVTHNPDSGTVLAHIRHGRVEVGEVKGQHTPDKSLNIEDANIIDEHQGKGLGQAAYSALMTHAFHNGVKSVAGGVHSTMASRVHTKLAQQHGMDYKPIPTPFPQLAAPTPGPSDNRMGPYNYAIKGELPATTEKAEAPGPAHMATGQLPPEAGTMPTMQGAKGPPKAKKLPLAPGMAKPASTLRVSKSQAERSCELCGLPQVRSGVLRGCLCFRSLIKGAKPDGDGYTLEVKGWDEDTLRTFLEAIGEK